MRSPLDSNLPGDEPLLHLGGGDGHPRPSALERAALDRGARVAVSSTSGKTSIMKKIAVHLTILLLVCAGIGGLRAHQGKDPAYRIGPRDLLSVRVDEDDKLNGDRRVSEAGTVNLPLLGDVQVAGKTTAEVGRSSRSCWKTSTCSGRRWTCRCWSSARARSRSSAPSSSRATSASPAAGRCSRRSPPPAALAENHGNVVYVLRRADNGLSDQVTIDLDDLLVRGDPKVNIPIFANDLINVPVTVEVTVYCLGEVAQAGGARLQEQRADHPAHRHRPRRRPDRPRVEARS